MTFSRLCFVPRSPVGTLVLTHISHVRPKLNPFVFYTHPVCFISAALTSTIRPLQSVASLPPREEVSSLKAKDLRGVLACISSHIRRETMSKHDQEARRCLKWVLARAVELAPRLTLAQVVMIFRVLAQAQMYKPDKCHILSLHAISKISSFDKTQTVKLLDAFAKLTAANRYRSGSAKSLCLARKPERDMNEIDGRMPQSHKTGGFRANQSLRRDNLILVPPYDLLIPMLCRHLYGKCSKLNASELTILASSLERLEFQDDTLLKELCIEAFSQVESLSSFGMMKLLLAFSSFQIEDDGEFQKQRSRLYDALTQKFQENISAADAPSLVQALRVVDAYQQLGPIADLNFLQSLLATMLVKSASFSTKHLSEFNHFFARIASRDGVDDVLSTGDLHGVWVIMSKEAQLKMPQASPEQIRSLCMSMSLVKVTDRDLMNSISARIKSLLGKSVQYLEDNVVRAVLDALCLTDFKDQELILLISDAAVRQVHNFEPKSIVSYFRAFAQFQVRHENMLQVLGPLLVDYAQKNAFSAKMLCELLISISKLPALTVSPILLGVLCSELVKNAKYIPTVQLVPVLESLVRLEVVDHVDAGPLLAALTQHVNHVESSLDSEQSRLAASLMSKLSPRHGTSISLARLKRKLF